MKTDLREVLAIQSYSGKEFRMFAYLIRYCKRNNIPFNVDRNNGNIYITKGEADTYPCIVAHMDTVHQINDWPLQVIESRGMLTGFDPGAMKQSGIGGDDKCGVYIALRCLEENDSLKVAFFVSEETGCVGSYAADMDFFSNTRFVLQADRREMSDFIVNASGTDLSGKEFQKAVAPYLKLYGFGKTSGMMTDVMALKENGLKVACANVSCGYHRPHCNDEYVVIRQVENTLNLFLDIITNCTQVYKHIPAPKTYGNYGGYGGAYGRDIDDWSDAYSTGYRNSWKGKSGKPEVMSTEERNDYLNFLGYKGYADANKASYMGVYGKEDKRYLLPGGYLWFPTIKELEQTYLDVISKITDHPESFLYAYDNGTVIYSVQSGTFIWSYRGDDVLKRGHSVPVPEDHYAAWNAIKLVQKLRRNHKGFLPGTSPSTTTALTTKSVKKEAKKSRKVKARYIRENGVKLRKVEPADQWPDDTDTNSDTLTDAQVDAKFDKLMKDLNTQRAIHDALQKEPLHYCDNCGGSTDNVQYSTAVSGYLCAPCEIVYRNY